jgi:hypothetical protein
MTRSNEVSMISAHDDNRSVARNKDEVFAVDVAITQTVHASTVKPDVEPEKSGDPNNNNTFLMDVSNESLSETERANTNSCANDAEKEENDDTDTKNETSKKLKRKLSLEIALVSGCGGGKKKIRTVEAFNDTLFPMLQEVGWTKVRATILYETKLVHRSSVDCLWVLCVLVVEACSVPWARCIM